MAGFKPGLKRDGFLEYRPLSLQTSRPGLKELLSQQETPVTNDKIPEKGGY